MTKERNASIDLLKIFAAMMIFGVHFLGNGILFNAEFGSFNTIIARGIESVIIVCVNIFIISSGYFGVTSKGLNVRRITDMLIMVAFFSGGSYLYNSIFVTGEFSVLKFLGSLIPYMIEGYWFIRVYLILAILAPFLNVVLTKLNKKSYLSLLIVFFVIFSVLSSLNKNFKNTGGFDIIHFVIMYSFGGYIRLHIKKLPNFFISIGVFLFLAFITTAISIYVDDSGCWNYDYITVILEAIFIFSAFLKLNFKNRFISFAAQSSLSIFVAEHIFNDLYDGILKVKDYMESIYFIPHFLVCLIGFTIFAFSLDIIRRFIFKYTVDKLLDKIPLLNKRVFTELEK